jgi:threonine dehydrogenase-like Zn-dependent dehydrogenase
VKAPSTIVISGAVQAYELAFKATAQGGRVIAVGVPHTPVPVNSKSVIMTGKNYQS